MDVENDYNQGERRSTNFRNTIAADTQKPTQASLYAKKMIRRNILWIYVRQLAAVHTHSKESKTNPL